MVKYILIPLPPSDVVGKQANVFKNRVYQKISTSQKSMKGEIYSFELDMCADAPPPLVKTRRRAAADEKAARRADTPI